MGVGGGLGEGRPWEQGNQLGSNEALEPQWEWKGEAGANEEIVTS